MAPSRGDVAPAAMAVRRQRHGRRGRLGRVEPADRQARPPAASRPARDRRARRPRSPPGSGSRARGSRNRCRRRPAGRGRSRSTSGRARPSPACRPGPGRCPPRATRRPSRPGRARATTTRPTPSAAAKTDAQPPIVPAPTITRSAWSATSVLPAPASLAVEGGRFDADRDHAEPRQAVERRTAADGPRRDLETGRLGARATDRASSARHCDGDAAAAERDAPWRCRAGRACARLSQRGHDGARRATRSSATASNDETTAFDRSGPRPAASTSTIARAGVALELDVEERPAPGQRAARRRASGTPSASQRVGRQRVDALRPAVGPRSVSS